MLTPNPVAGGHSPRARVPPQPPPCRRAPARRGTRGDATVAAVKADGRPVSYVSFEGEQHGIGKAENIRRALDGELYFYSRVLGFDLPDDVEPVEIENLQ